MGRAGEGFDDGFELRPEADELEVYDAEGNKVAGQAEDNDAESDALAA